LEEHRADNSGVGGSNPSTTTKTKRKMANERDKGVCIPSGYEPVERLTGHMGVRILPGAPNIPSGVPNNMRGRLTRCRR
jgi:hypothetical protein